MINGYEMMYKNSDSTDEETDERDSDDDIENNVEREKVMKEMKKVFAKVSTTKEGDDVKDDENNDAPTNVPTSEINNDSTNATNTSSTMPSSQHNDTFISMNPSKPRIINFTGGNNISSSTDNEWSFTSRNTTKANNTSIHQIMHNGLPNISTTNQNFDITHKEIDLSSMMIRNDDVNTTNDDEYYYPNDDSNSDNDENTYEDNYELSGGNKRKKPSKSSPSTKRKKPSSKSSPSSKTKPSTKRPSTKSPTVSITPEIKILSNIFIYIRYNKVPTDSSQSVRLFNSRVTSRRIIFTVNQYIINFLRHINYIIAAKTNVNYQLIDSKQLFIRIPVYVYTNEEAALHPLDLILKRVNALRTFLTTYDFSLDTKSTLWLIRTLTNVGINMNKDFSLTVDCTDLFYEKIDEEITFNIPTIEYPTVRRHVMKDGSHLIEYEDPYFNDYGIFHDLSVPFDEMGMSYNGLHLYEHLMTKGWIDLSVNDQIYANGITYPNGICMVYNVLATEKSFHEYVNATLEWIYKVRNEDFWKKDINDDLLLETYRTISETRTERTLASMGRSDLHAYTNSYNKQIFEYWANKPFNLLITMPKGTKRIDIDKVEQLALKHPLRTINRPKNIKLKYYPLEVLMSKERMKTFILKVSTDKIKNAILMPKLKTKMYFGVDCYMGQNALIAENNDLSEYNSVLHPILHLNRLFTDEEIDMFLKTHITACSSATMSMQSMMIRHAADHLDEYNLNL